MPESVFAKLHPPGFLRPRMDQRPVVVLK